MTTNNPTNNHTHVNPNAMVNMSAVFLLRVR